MKNIKNNSLYLVITEEYGRGRSAVEIAKAAIAGGADIIQMREKDKTRDELVMLGKDLGAVCKESGVIFIVNDDPVLAKEVDADGVHLGQEDAGRFLLSGARRILGEDKIIGISTHSPAQFRLANESDFDYIAFGPVFPTKTKAYSIGTADIEKIMKGAKKPVFCIGGINLSNIDKVLEKGTKNIALIRGISEADDIVSKVMEFKARLIGAKEDSRA